MNKLEIKGELTKRKGLQKQKEACRTGDRFKCIEGKEEELTGKLQKEFGRDDQEILKTMEKTDEEYSD